MNADDIFLRTMDDLLFEWGEVATMTDEGDILDIMMLRSPMEWTGTRMLEIIDHQHSNDDWRDRKEWD